jgi:flagellar biosynthesis/type III secretory pathway protein FliH
MAAPRTYTFPARAEVGLARTATGTPSEDDLMLQAALARGYEDGLAQGREAAGEALKSAAEAARQQALDEGRDAGLAELRSVVQALRAALDGNARARAALAEEAEAFAVELALAAVARLAAVDEVRADFIKRAIAAGLQTLSPQPPMEILLNPADAAWAKAELADLPVRADETIVPGSVRIDAGRLLVESGIDQALEHIRCAVFATRARRERTRGT